MVIKKTGGAYFLLAKKQYNTSVLAEKGYDSQAFIGGAPTLRAVEQGKTSELY